MARPKKAVRVVDDEDRKEVTNVYSRLPVVGTPPPPLANYEGMEEMKRLHPEHVVTLDAGVFMTLWRVVENKALMAYTNPTTPPEYLDVMMRAATAFRLSNDAMNARFLVPRPKRVIKQR